MQPFLKNFLYGLMALLISLSIFACSSGPQAAQNKIDKIAQDMKKDLPKMLDQDTKLVTVYTEKLKLISEYELVNYDPTETGNQKIKGEIEVYLKNQVCPGIKKELLSNGVSARYIYKGKDGQVIVDSLLAPGDC